MEEYILFSKCCGCDSKITETATINEDGERICVDCYEVCYAESEDKENVMEYTPSNALAISEHLERLALQEEIRNYPCTHNEMSWQVEMMKHSTVLWEFHKVYDLPTETLKQKEAKQNGFQSLNWASAHSEFLK